MPRVAVRREQFNWRYAFARLDTRCKQYVYVILFGGGCSEKGRVEHGPWLKVRPCRWVGCCGKISGLEKRNGSSITADPRLLAVNLKLCDKGIAPSTDVGRWFMEVSDDAVRDREGALEPIRLGVTRRLDWRTTRYVSQHLLKCLSGEAWATGTLYYSTISYNYAL